MTSTQITTDIARNMTLDELERLGRFNLRVIAELTYMFTEEEAKIEFMRMTSAAQAKVVYDRLRGRTTQPQLLMTTEQRIKVAVSSLIDDLLSLHRAQTKTIVDEINRALKET